MTNDSASPTGHIRPRVLYIHPGQAPPNTDPCRNACHFLGQYLDGDLVTLTWENPDEYRANLSAHRSVVGKFGYVARPRRTESTVTRKLLDFVHYVRSSLQLVRTKGRYDAIVAYAPFRTAWAGAIVSVLTRTPLIVQMTVNPFASLGHYHGGARRGGGFITRLSVRLLLLMTRRVHLLYEAQAELFSGMHLPPVSVFPDFTPVSMVPPHEEAKPYVLFLGFPWKLKGVDVLIRAFREVAHEFPGITLKIVGHCPDRSEFEVLADGCSRIEFLKAQEHPEAMRLMSECLFFVLPSRTEGIPRVIMEAWAGGKAVVASRVDGIPHLVREGVDGLLFESENVADLTVQLRALLSDRSRAMEMGREGQKRVRECFTEEHYARAFRDMVLAAMKR